MAKANFKDLFLAKGEKILLFGAGGLAALLLIWGVVAMAGTDDPNALAKELKDKSTALDGKRANDVMPEGADKTKPLSEDFLPVSADLFRVRQEQYEVTVWPSLRRENPLALAPVDSQIDLVLGSVKKFARDDFKYDGDELVDYRMAVLSKAIDVKADARALADWYRNQTRNKKQQRRQPAAGGGGVAGGPGGPGGPMGGPGGPMGGPGGPGGGRSGPQGMPGGGMLGMGFPAGGKTSEDVVEWMNFSVASKEGKTPVYLVYPTRMAVVQLAVPLKEQLEEIRKALRLRTLELAVAESSPNSVMVKNPETGEPMPYTGGAVGGLGMPGGFPGGPGGPGGATGSPDGMRSGGGNAGMRGPGGPGSAPMMGAGGPAMPGGPGGVSGVAGMTQQIASPVFAGFDVERRMIYPDGKESAWEKFDHAGQWFDEFGRYDAPVMPEGGYLPYFQRPEQDLVAPMPVLSSNWTVTPQQESVPTSTYPPQIRMAPLQEDYQRLQAEKRAQIPKDQALARYNRNVSGYGGAARSNTLQLPGGMGEDDMMGRGPTSGFAAGFGMPLAGVGAPGMGEGMGPGMAVGTTPSAFKLPVNHTLIRFLDTDLEPGVSYQYRVAVKVRNPNYGKPDKVAKKDLANQDVIASPFFQVKQTLNVPAESFLYAYSPKEYEKKVAETVEPYKGQGNDQQMARAQLLRLFEEQDVREGRRAVVQMQRWVPTTLFGEVAEPVGAWVQSEIPVAVGEFIGKKMLVELPLWRAALGTHILTPPKENAKPLIARWPTKQTQPLGRPVDFRTPHVLMDFEGGKTAARVGNTSVVDEAGTELLILREDGRVEVRKELADAEVKERKDREKGWKEWIELVKKRSPAPGAEGFSPGGRGGPAGASGSPDGGGR
jgi:hypothetical protein